MLKKILSSIAEFCYERHIIVFLIAGIITAISTYFMLQLRISSNNMDLLPQDSKLIKEFWEVNEDFGAQDRHIMLAETPDTAGANPELIKEFVHRFDSALQQTGLVRSVSYSITDRDKAFVEDFFIHHALLYLSPADLDSVMQRLEDHEIEKRILRTKNILNAPVPPGQELKSLLRDDPLLLSEIFMPYIRKILGSKNAALLQARDSYFFSKDKKTLLVFVKPVMVATETKFCETFVETNIRIRDSILSVMDPSGSNLKITFGGNYVTALANSRAVRQGLISSSFIVIIMIILLFVFFFGRVRAIAVIMLPILAGVTWVFCLGDLLFTRVNIITAAAGAMLLGLGVDYAIHTFNRFIEEDQQHHHRSVLENTLTTFRETGLSVFYGMISTACVFMVLMITEFRGLYELGFMGGIGIAVIFSAVLFIIPAFIRIYGRRPTRKRYLQIAFNHFLKRISLFVLRHPKYITTGAAFITLFMLAVLADIIPSRDEGFGITFDENIENIRSKNDIDIQLIKRLQDKFGTHFKPLSIVTSGTTDGELITKLTLLNRKLDTLQKRGTVLDYNSMLRYIPPIADQRANLMKIEQLDVEGILFKVRLELSRQGLKLNYFRLDRLKDLLSVSSPVTIESFQTQGFSEIMRHYYVERDGIKKVVTQVELSGTSHDIHIVNNFVQDIQSDPVLEKQNYILTGIRVMTAEFLRLVKKDFQLALWASVVIVILLVALKYRNFKAMMVCMVPLIFSLAIIMGIMRIFGIKINFVNMVALPLLIGTGVDYGIYIISRYLEDFRHDVVAAITETGQSLFLSALTTMIGFGSLMVVDNQGLSGLGTMCAVGIFICALSSVIILPALLRLWGKKIWKETSIMEKEALITELEKTQSMRKKRNPV